MRGEDIPEAYLTPRRIVGGSSVPTRYGVVQTDHVLFIRLRDLVRDEDLTRFIL